MMPCFIFFISASFLIFLHTHLREWPPLFSAPLTHFLQGLLSCTTSYSSCTIHPSSNSPPTLFLSEAAGKWQDATPMEFESSDSCWLQSHFPAALKKFRKTIINLWESGRMADAPYLMRHIWCTVYLNPRAMAFLMVVSSSHPADYK